MSAAQRIRSTLNRPRVTTPMLVVLVLLWIVTVDNLALWRELSARISLATVDGVGYVLTLSALMLLLLAVPTLLTVPKLLLKTWLALLLILSGVLAYFIGELGVVFDVDMIRNVAETVRDHNVQEGTELLSLAMLKALLISVALPLWLLLRADIRQDGIGIELRRRLVWSVSLLVIAGTLVMLNYRNVTYISRENHDLETRLNPHYPILKARRFLVKTYAARDVQFVELGTDATRPAPARRTIGVMVVGETARADHLSLNGYHRKTNPELEQRNIINFTNATACGTSTAWSVPCMFSFMNADSYSPEEADARSNVLDVIARTGVEVFWVDINSSCKGVCKRVPNLNLTKTEGDDPGLYSEGAWRDEVLPLQLEKAIADSDARAAAAGVAAPDLLVVLHTMGSHGPAYYRRVPPEFARFSPYCRNKAPQDCAPSETVNAYDNTILYTDHVLATIIDQLHRRGERSFMLYASDHGESLGESGVFLHGLPRFMAPAAQTQVPMLAWFSSDFALAPTVDAAQAKPRQIGTPVSHDNLSASLLGLFNIQTTLYQPALDLFRNLPADNPL